MGAEVAEKGACKLQRKLIAGYSGSSKPKMRAVSSKGGLWELR